MDWEPEGISRKGASCSAVTAALFWRIMAAILLQRRCSMLAFGSPSPKTREYTASRKDISDWEDERGDCP